MERHSRLVSVWQRRHGLQDFRVRGERRVRLRRTPSWQLLGSRTEAHPYGTLRMSWEHQETPKGRKRQPKNWQRRPLGAGVLCAAFRGLDLGVLRSLSPLVACWLTRFSCYMAIHAI